MSYRVNELFWSIQGEGVNAGQTAIFIRLQGCPVGCSWCDSKLTWYGGGEALSLEELIRRLRQLPSAAWFVITGGEPLLHDLDDLLCALDDVFPFVQTQLETSGALPFKGQTIPDWVTLSPKAAAGWQVDGDVLNYADELKFVVDTDFDPQVVERFLVDPRAPLPVSLMPEGAPPSAANVAKTLALLRDFPGWRFGPRLQYAYPAIAEGEGRNNEIVSVDEARRLARAAVQGRS